MQQLSGLDAAFLTLDSPTAYGHVGSVCILEPPQGGEALSLDRLTELVESRLHLVPPFRRRLAEVPLGLDQPYWIEDPDFDIEFHVRELALPAPGDDRQLATQAARLHARPQAPAMGAVPDPWPARWPVWPLHQGAPRCDRRGVRKRPARRPAGCVAAAGRDRRAAAVAPGSRTRRGAAAGSQRGVADPPPGAGGAALRADGALVAGAGSQSRPALAAAGRPVPVAP